MVLMSSRTVYAQVLRLMRSKVVEVRPSLAASLAARKLRLERMMEALETGQLRLELN